MSSTELYRVGTYPGKIGTIRNAWIGAMYVWDDIAKRYFSFDSFPYVARDRNKVWNASRTHPLSHAERIVLVSTLDNAVMSGQDAVEIISAFEEYGQAHPRSSYRTQANIIKAAFASDDPPEFVAWNQTSVCSFWGQRWEEPEREDDYEGDDDTDYTVWYDPHTSNLHFDIMAEVRKDEKDLIPF